MAVRLGPERSHRRSDPVARHLPAQHQDLVAGWLNGVQYGLTFMAHDCYELGRQAYNSAYIQGIQRFDVLLRILRDDLIFFRSSNVPPFKITRLVNFRQPISHLQNGLAQMRRPVIFEYIIISRIFHETSDFPARPLT